MKKVFVETLGFTDLVSEYFEDDQAYADLQLYLLEQPEVGDVMRRCGGLRKLRWIDPRRGKGKRGGLRVIYLHIPESDRIYIFDVYDKDEADDLTPAQRQILAGVAERLRSEELMRRNNR